MQTVTREQIELKKASQRLARRKHRMSWFIGLSECGNFGVWKGMLHGNTWKYDIAETNVLLRIGARNVSKTIKAQ